MLCLPAHSTFLDSDVAARQWLGDDELPNGNSVCYKFAVYGSQVLVAMQHSHSSRFVEFISRRPNQATIVCFHDVFCMFVCTAVPHGSFKGNQRNLGQALLISKRREILYLNLKVRRF